MATPTIRGIGNIAAGAAVSITPGPPSGHAAGDIEYLFVETGGDLPSLSDAQGFDSTPVLTSIDSGNNTRLTVFWRRWDGSAGSPTVAATTNHVIGRIISIQGAIATGIPHEAVVTGTHDTAVGTINIPGGTTSGNERLILAAATTDLPDSTSTTNFSNQSNPNLTSVFIQINNTRAAGNGGGIVVISGIQATAGAVGTTNVDTFASSVAAMGSFAVFETAGVTSFSGDIAASIPAPTASVSGSLGFNGDIAASVAAPGSSGSASLGFNGSVSASVPAPTTSADATWALGVSSADIAATVPAPTTSADAVITAQFAASISASIPSPISALSANNLTPIAGTISTFVSAPVGALIASSDVPVRGKVSVGHSRAHGLSVAAVKVFTGSAFVIGGVDIEHDV